MLALTTMIWGSGFVINAELRASSFANTPALLNAVRFGIAALCLLAVFNRKIRFNKRTLFHGAVGGALLFGAFMLQTVALSYTTPAHNGFFTAAYVVFVPFITWIVYKKRPSWILFIGAGVAICGLLVLNLKSETLPQGSWKGDLLTLGCAICFALQIIWTDILLTKNKTDSVQLSFWQVAFAAILFIAYTLIFEHKYVFNINFDFGYCWWRLAIVTVGGTAFAYFAQTYAQNHVSPTETSIIMACESPIGASLSLLVGLDVLTWTIPVGGCMVIAAVILVEIVPSIVDKRKQIKGQTDDVISVLIGLIGACNNNPKTENTDKLILTALSFPSNGCSETELIEQLRAEKNVIAPSCATCDSPCGNTPDYDMGRIYNAKPAIRNLKQRVLADIRQLATYVLKNDIALTEESMFLFYKALSYVSYDLNEQPLIELLGQIQQTKLQIKANNQ